MQLEELRVQNYKSIDDSGWVGIDDISCLIGKNESGKTAFVEAVEKLNPSFGDGNYTPFEQYPRKDWTEYKIRHQDGDPDVVASAKFTLEDGERAEIEEEYGDVIAGDDVILRKDFQNDRHWDLEIDESAFINDFLDYYDLHNKTYEKLRKSETIAELHENIEESESEDVDPLLEDLEPDVTAISTTIGEDVLWGKVPQFRYMGEYSILDATIGVNELVGKENRGNSNPRTKCFWLCSPWRIST